MTSGQCDDALHGALGPSPRAFANESIQSRVLTDRQTDGRLVPGAGVDDCPTSRVHGSRVPEMGGNAGNASIRSCRWCAVVRSCPTWSQVCLFVWLVCHPGWKDARVRSGQDGGSRYITGGLAAPHQQTRPAPPHITSPCSSSSWWVPSTQIHDYKYISLIFLLWTIYIVSFTSTFLKKSFIYFSKIFTSYKNDF